MHRFLLPLVLAIAFSATACTRNVKPVECRCAETVAAPVERPEPADEPERPDEPESAETEDEVERPAEDEKPAVEKPATTARDLKPAYVPVEFIAPAAADGEQKPLEWTESREEATREAIGWLAAGCLSKLPEKPCTSHLEPGSELATITAATCTGACCELASDAESPASVRLESVCFAEDGESIGVEKLQLR